MSKTLSKDTGFFVSIYTILLRAAARRRLWLRTLVDLVLTAPREHLEKIRKENKFMRNLRTDLFAIGGFSFFFW